VTVALTRAVDDGSAVSVSIVVGSILVEEAADALLSVDTGKVLLVMGTVFVVLLAGLSEPESSPVLELLEPEGMVALLFEPEVEPGEMPFVALPVPKGKPDRPFVLLPAVWPLDKVPFVCNVPLLGKVPFAAKDAVGTTTTTVPVAV
jgi:hypothetical protein